MCEHSSSTAIDTVTKSEDIEEQLCEVTQGSGRLTCQKVRKTTILTTMNFKRGLKGASSSCVPI